uniref:PROP1-like PPR domain-containing protein n=1 Tax=Rhizophora mucronata TaxID=61149 RepID=A0A2P2LSH7_RHIMU
MDHLSLSAKFQTLTLMSCAQLSTFSPSTKRLRSGFLGCAHNLRPPGGRPPRFRSKCKKPRVRGNQYQRVLITAELDSSAVLAVVAVTLLSALSLLYFNQDPKKKEKKNKKSSDSDEVLDSLGLALSQFGRSIVNHNIGSPIVCVGDCQMLVPVTQKDLVENAKINSYEVEGEEIQCRESTLLPDRSLLDKKTESPEADSLASDTCNIVVSERSEVTGVCLPSPVPLKSDDVQHIVATKNSQSMLVNARKGAVSDSEFAGPALKTNATIASFPVNQESGKKRDFSSYFGIFKESVSEDLYTFDGVNQSVMVSLPSLNSLKVVSSYASPLNSNEFPLLKANPVLKRAELSAEQSIDIAERKEPVAHYDGCSFQKNMNLGRGKGFPRGEERRNLALENYTKLPQLPHPSGKIVKDKDHLPEQLRAYNHLLRVGRLSDCINILEDLERRGSLDMNKLYHAKFFEICRRQKAAKEAFHFCKLIPNPTLSTFNMLMSVCASSQDSEGAFQVLRLSQDAGLKADCKLYTTLISTCAKSGRVDTMFEVFHEMVNAGVDPNVLTYGALIDGCARAGQVAKAFGAYGIMRSKNVKPDRVVFNALITACGQSGAVDRAFDVLAEMKGETQPIDPDHITVGALIKACANVGQIDRAKEVYNMLHEYNIKGTPEVYTIAVNCFSKIGDWDSACSVYDDMKMKGVITDEVFLSALIDVAGHAGKIDAAFEILQEARIQGKQLGIITYSSLMGACSNAKNWQKALELYEDIKSVKLKPTVSTMNALISALCDGDQLLKAIEVLSQMKSYGLCPNTITYSTLLVASEKKDDLEVGLVLCSQAKEDCVVPTLLMCKCIIGMLKA